MDLNLQILDMTGSTPAHSAVIVNFIAAIRNQLRNSTCFVYSDNVQYKWMTKEGEEKTVIRMPLSIARQKRKEEAISWVFLVL